jgi:uncharacterized protein
MYVVDEVEFLCPWRIADGSAAQEFEAEFITADGAPGDVPSARIRSCRRRAS